MKIGILGCGVISNTYVRDIRKFYPELEIISCADADVERAKQWAEKYEVSSWYDVDGLLEDEQVELVVNLTPPQFHSALNFRILQSGKHLFCEKPFATSLEEAIKIRNLASEKGLFAGSAPDTFLGKGIARGKRLLEEGAIGTPLYVNANMISGGMEGWHPAPEAFYKPGAGPIFDMGPYYVTTLVDLFGPVSSIQAVSATGFPVRKIATGPKAGNEFEVHTPTYYSALLQMKSGVLVTLTMTFDVSSSGLPMFEIYGTEGTLRMPDPNMSDGPLTLTCKWEKKADWEKLEEESRGVGESYTRGSGVYDVATAALEGKKNRTNLYLATHVVEVLCKIIQASETGMRCEVETLPEEM